MPDRRLRRRSTTGKATTKRAGGFNSLSPEARRIIKEKMGEGPAEGALFRTAAERTGVAPQSAAEALKMMKASKEIVEQELGLIAHERAKKAADRKGLNAEQEKLIRGDILRILKLDHRNYGRKGYRHD